MTLVGLHSISVNGQGILWHDFEFFPTFSGLLRHFVSHLPPLFFFSKLLLLVSNFLPATSHVPIFSSDLPPTINLYSSALPPTFGFPLSASAAIAPLLDALNLTAVV